MVWETFHYDIKKACQAGKAEHKIDSFLMDEKKEKFL